VGVSDVEVVVSVVDGVDVAGIGGPTAIICASGFRIVSTVGEVFLLKKSQSSLLSGNG
jgi:hypothetical protein